LPRMAVWCGLMVCARFLRTQQRDLMPVHTMHFLVCAGLVLRGRSGVAGCF
jgi:hypothetical protein